MRADGVHEARLNQPRRLANLITRDQRGDLGVNTNWFEQF
jgi:hypothetical protein